MSREPVKIPAWRTRANGVVPEYMTAGAAGCDLSAALDEPVTLPPLGRAMIPTGIAIALPEGFEGQVRPRSGLAAREGITVLNAPGTIDSDYRGEIQIVLINLSDSSRVIAPGERIAQLVVAPVSRASFELVEAGSRQQEQLAAGRVETARGAGGFGHTGRAVAAPASGEKR